MQCQSEITECTKAMRAKAGEVKQILRRQFDLDFAELDLRDNAYLNNLAKLSQLAEGIEFRCDIIDQWLSELAKLRKTLQREVVVSDIGKMELF
jgi:hypothetical protein